MSELDILMEKIEPAIGFNEKYDSEFPRTDEYVRYVVDWVEKHEASNWCNRNGEGLYDIMQKRERPFGIYDDATLSENGIYLL